MGSTAGDKRSKSSNPQNPKIKQNPIGPKRAKTKLKSKRKRDKNKAEPIQNVQNSPESNEEARPASAARRQLCFFLDQFQSANGVQLSSLELESIKDTCIAELSQDANQDGQNLGKHMKVAFGSSWKETLCGKQLSEGKVDPGCPALLIVCSSALRSIELLRGFRSLTKDCHAVKLFSKHMKVEEQHLPSNCGLEEMMIRYNRLVKVPEMPKFIYLHVSLLKNRVNIACGTPNRIKKLIDIEALGLSRLAVILLDIHPDVKGYSLFTLPQVRDEFWDLYKYYFHPRLLESNVRICLFGPIQSGIELEGRKKGSS